MKRIVLDLNSKSINALQKIWIVHHGRDRNHRDTFLSEGVIFLEFPGLSLSPKSAQDDSVIRQQLRYSQALKAARGLQRDDGTTIRLAQFGGAAGSDVSIHLRTVKHLISRIKVGDLVIVPTKGSGGRVLFGEVSSEFFPQRNLRIPRLDFADTPVRKVEWLQDRPKLDLPPELAKFFEKPPAIAQVHRDSSTERFFDFAYDAYSTDDKSWVSIEAPKYDGHDFLALIPPAQLFTLAVALYRAVEKRADLNGLTYEEIVLGFYDESALAHAQIKFSSAGRYNFKDKDAQLALFINAFVALAVAGALSACSAGAEIAVENSKSPNDPASADIREMVEQASRAAGRDVLDRAEAQAREASRKMKMTTPAKVIP